MPRGHGAHKTAFRDLTSQRFGKWLVLSQTENAPTGRVRWLCRCDCGEERAVVAGHLVSGNSTSCGCTKYKIKRHAKYKPGGELHYLFQAWRDIQRRCLNPESEAYADYGGRGIKIAEAWLDFETFAKDVGLRPSRKHSINRIDNDGHYEPGNVNWVDRNTQARNTRRTKLIKFNGQEKSLAEWCEELNLYYPTVKHRLLSGWSPERALR